MKDEDKMFPPFSGADEAAVLGSMLANDDCVLKAYEGLRADDFFMDKHIVLYQTIIDMYKGAKKIDATTVFCELKRLNIADLFMSMGTGNEMLLDIARCFVSPDNIGDHVHAVKSYSVMRKLMLSCSKIISDCQEHKKSSTAIVETAEKMVYESSVDANIKAGLSLVGDGMHRMVEAIEKNKGRSGVLGISSGLSQLDEVTGGFQPGNLIVLGARPGIGKTSLAVQIAVQTAIVKKIPVAYYSLEMNQVEMAFRVASSYSGIPLWNLKHTTPDGSGWNKILEICGQVKESPFFADTDSFNLNPVSLRSSCRRFFGKMEREGKKLGLIVVDYVQLMKDPGTHENRQSEVSEISRSLKALAMDLNVPVLALAQLNRGTVTDGGNRKPRCSDLRDSGSLEQDADIVLLLWKENQYVANATQEKRDESLLIVDKNRNGQTRDIDLIFRGAIARFGEIEKIEESGGRLL